MDEEAFYAARLELIDFPIEVFWDVPDEAFVRNLLEGDVMTPDDTVNEPLDEGFAHLETFIETNRGRPVEDVRDGLGREYTRVFVGPRPPVLAHETYYRDDTEFIGEGLAAVEASYAAAGWTAPGDYDEENDFVAVELAFLRNLIGRQRSGEEEAFGFERVFLEEHVHRWVDDFVQDVRAETDHPLFLAAAGVLEGLVEFETELVGQLA